MICFVLWFVVLWCMYLVMLVLCYLLGDCDGVLGMCEIDWFDECGDVFIVFVWEDGECCVLIMWCVGIGCIGCIEVLFVMLNVLVDIIMFMLFVFVFDYCILFDIVMFDLGLCLWLEVGFDVVVYVVVIVVVVVLFD